MKLFNRRTALSLGLASVLVTGQQAAVASSRRPRPATATSSRPVAAVPAVGQVPVEHAGLHLALQFAGAQSQTVRDRLGRAQLALAGLPVSLVIANAGSEPVRAGTRVQVKARGADAAGLLTGPQQVLQVAGAANNVRSLLAIGQGQAASELTLSRGLAPGDQLRVDLLWQLPQGLASHQVTQVQLSASAVLVSATHSYYEAQSSEVMVTRS